jgi:hypothetical protein
MIVPSNLKNSADVIRLAKSVDVSEKIHLYFINQSTTENLKNIYEFKKCKITEITTNGVVPLAQARNIAFSSIYKNENPDNKLVLFPDDDAWFPIETIEFLLNCDKRAYALKTIDPKLNKSFNKVTAKEERVIGRHVIKDICSICFVVPLNFLLKKEYCFNEKLGLGNEISQGEESLFIYTLYKDGLDIKNDDHLVYHPYKSGNSLKNYYSMSYFWTVGLTHISSIFLIPCIQYLMKYTIALGLIIRDKKYFSIFKAVWKGAADGFRDTKNVLG